jgi:hypothetical protein
MTSFADDVLGTEITERVEILQRLLSCSLGAIYLNKYDCFDSFLKTLHYYCKSSAYSFIAKFGALRMATRRIRSRWVDLLRICTCEDVLERTDVTEDDYDVALLRHLSAFSNQTDFLLDSESRSDIIVAFEAIISITILTWKYIEYCLSADVINNPSILRLEDVSDNGLRTYEEYRYMHGIYWV